MRSAPIVVGDVCHDGAAKVVLRKEEEVVQTLPLQTPHEAFDVGCRVGGSVWGGHPIDTQDLTQPQVQGTAIRFSRLAGLTPAELAEDPIVVM